MALPSFCGNWRNEKHIKARIYVLEVRDRKKPDDAPIAWILLERQETHRRDDRDGSMHEASIRIYYERMGPKYSHFLESGCFSGSYSRGYVDTPSVSITSGSTEEGAVFLDLQGLEGQRIGTYLMNEIVTWAKQWPQAAVRPVHLMAGQAHDENKARRNRFWRQFGLEFDYTDPDHRAGISQPMTAKALNVTTKWQENLRELSFSDYLETVLYEKEHLALEVAQLKRATENLSSSLKHIQNHPWRWALRRLWWRYAHRLISSCILASAAAAIWISVKT